MNSQKRHKLKKRMTNLFRIGWLGGLSITLIGVILRITNDTKEISFGLLCTVLLVGGVLIAIVSHFIGTDLSMKLRREKGRIFYERYKLHLGRFYNLIDSKDLEDALDVFNKFIARDASKNIDDFSTTISQGILLGVIKENYNLISESTKKSVEKRLKNIRAIAEIK